MEISEKHLVIRAELSLLFLQLKYSTKAFSVKLSRISVLEQVQLSTIGDQMQIQEKLIGNKSEFPLWFCCLFLTSIKILTIFINFLSCSELCPSLLLTNWMDFYI